MLIDITLQVIGDDFSHHVNWDTESAIWLAIVIFVLITLFGTHDGLNVAHLFFYFLCRRVTVALHFTVERTSK